MSEMNCFELSVMCLLRILSVEEKYDYNEIDAYRRRTQETCAPNRHRIITRSTCIMQTLHSTLPQQVFHTQNSEASTRKLSRDEQCPSITATTQEIAMDRTVTSSINDVSREYPQIAMPSSQAASSPQSTSTIFSNDGNYPFHYFMEERDPECTVTESWKTKSHPTPRGIANSMTVIDQPWNQNSEGQWPPNQAESSSFFCIDTDRDSDSGSNDTAPSTISSVQNSSPVYLESSRSLFGIDPVDQIRAKLDHGSPQSRTLGNSASISDHQATPAFSELLLNRRQRFNSYPGTYEHLQVRSSYDSFRLVLTRVPGEC
jgi:hypothetical protein